MKVLNDVLGYKDLKIYQDTNMFAFTLDSILISRFPKFNSKIKKIIDFGTNNAIIPLIISRYTKAKIDAIEIQAKAAELAKENIALNNLDKQISIITGDIKEFIAKNLHKWDMVICNPPFFAVNEKSNLNEKNEYLIPARHEVAITLAEIIFFAAQALRNKGVFVVVHRAERFGEIMENLFKNKLKPKRVKFIYSKDCKKAKTVLIDAVLNGNDGMEILRPMVIHNDDESYSTDIGKWFED